MNRRATRAVRITVTDANDPGRIIITGNAQPGVVRVRERLTARVHDEDDARSAFYIWQSGVGENYRTIKMDGADVTGTTYLTRQSDLGRMLRVIATYSDTFANGISLESTPTAAVSIAPPNTAPTINAGNQAPNHPENTTAVATYIVTNVDNTALAWSLTGTDASFFMIDADGALAFNDAPNFEDDTHDATYDVTVHVTETDGDPSNLASEQSVTVTVLNEDEAGSVSRTMGIAQVGKELTAGTVTDLDSPDPDSPVAVTGYRWDGRNPNNLESTYELVDGDVGEVIRVEVTYNDGQGSDKKARRRAGRPHRRNCPADYVCWRRS